uniref:DRBM domain-containing protein n=1 Tax=Leersia perrieri TaxID=77586 RepID=A0A0D9WYN6_9ORYZ
MESSSKGTQEFSLEASHGGYTQQLELLLKQLGFHKKPVHHGEQVIRGFQKNWRMKIYIQGQEEEHQGHVFKSVHLRAGKEAALQDAAREAFMRLYGRMQAIVSLYRQGRGTSSIGLAIYCACIRAAQSISNG